MSFFVTHISNAIQTVVENAGFNLLREYQGHGIGREMHEDPGVPNIGKKGRGERLQKGMALAIEPMVNMGERNVYDVDEMTKQNAGDYFYSFGLYLNLKFMAYFL